MHHGKNRKRETIKDNLYCPGLKIEVKAAIKNARVANCLKIAILSLAIFQRNNQKQIHGRKYALTSLYHLQYAKKANINQI